MIVLGLALLFLPLGSHAALTGLVVVGFGCAPVFPSLIHATPAHFGAEHSQAVIGVQMASACAGISLMPPLFGRFSAHTSLRLFPVYLLVLLVLMIASHERLCGGGHA